MTQRVTPYLFYEDGEAAIEFAGRGFGFREGFENPGKVGRTSMTYVIVDDVDGHYEQAKAAGARITEEPNDTPFGHRRYSCADPQGHEWSFAQVL